LTGLCQLSYAIILVNKGEQTMKQEIAICIFEKQTNQSTYQEETL